MKTYLTISTTELHSVDFSDVNIRITNAETAPKTVAGDRALIKYVGSEPVSIQKLTTKSDPLTHAQALALLATPEWTPEELF